MFLHLEFGLTVVLVVLILWAGCLGRWSAIHGFDRNATIPLRAILAYCVVTRHVPPCEFLNLGTIAVSVFFFMSGYGIQKSSERSECYLHGMVGRHSVKLLIPFFVCAIPYFFRLAFHGASINGGMRDLGYAVAQLRNGTIAFVPNGWYPLALLVFSLAASISLRFTSTSRYLICMGLMAGYYWVTRWYLGWPYHWWFSTLSFPMGILYASYELTVLVLIGKHKFLIPVVFLVFYAGLYVVVTCCLPAIPVLPELLHALFVPAVVLAVSLFPLPRWGWLVFLGAISYEIYLVHGIVYSVLLRLGMPSVVTVFGVYLLTPIVAYMVHCFSKLIIYKLDFFKMER